MGRLWDGGKKVLVLEATGTDNEVSSESDDEDFHIKVPPPPQTDRGTDESISSDTNEGQSKAKSDARKQLFTIDDNISVVKMPPTTTMRKRGRPKCAGLTVIGLP